jgi:hypothetical protein
VKVLKAGKFSLGVASSTGITQKKSLLIEPAGEQTGKFTFELVGDIRIGETIEVVAWVTNPAVGQTMNLTLPRELKLLSDSARQPLSPGAEAVVRWRVQVVQAGRLPVRVESSTGLARTKTIVLAAESESLFGR